MCIYIFTVLTLILLNINKYFGSSKFDILNYYIMIVNIHTLAK